jgi:hypothetical protein
MRIPATLSLMFMLACSQAQAGHSQNNGTCEDDITHWSNMIEKRSDAPLYARSKELHSLAQKSNSVWQCENLMEEALRMIRKTDGEYPTE